MRNLIQSQNTSPIPGLIVGDWIGEGVAVRAEGRQLNYHLL